MQSHKAVYVPTTPGSRNVSQTPRGPLRVGTEPATFVATASASHSANLAGCSEKRLGSAGDFWSSNRGCSLLQIGLEPPVRKPLSHPLPFPLGEERKRGEKLSRKKKSLGDKPRRVQSWGKCSGSGGALQEGL